MTKYLWNAQVLPGQKACSSRTHNFSESESPLISSTLLSMSAYLHGQKLHFDLPFYLPPEGVPGSVSGKEPTCKAGDTWDVGADPWVGRAWQPIPVFLLGESDGQRSLVDYSLWGPRESDMTETSRKSLLVSWMEPICTSALASQDCEIPPEFLSQIRMFHPLKSKPCPPSLLSLLPFSLFLLTSHLCLSFLWRAVFL